MNSVTIDSLEESLNKEKWEPEYCEVGEPLDYPSLMINVDERVLYVEIVTTDSSERIRFLKICEYDDNDVDFLEVWEISDVESEELVIETIKDFVKTV